MGYVSHGRNAINKELTDEDYFREASTLKVNLGILNGYLTRIQSLTEEILKDKTIGGK